MYADCSSDLFAEYESQTSSLRVCGPYGPDPLAAVPYDPDLLYDDGRRCVRGGCCFCLMAALAVIIAMMRHVFL